ncbi:MAG TPA: DnaJ domain-containing protein [Anaerolineales bacterium]|nr:DnaJ domain-containing protein [Anaerolineales bacterium]
MSDHLRDYYDLLGLSRDATPEEIKRAYFESAQKLHPDKNKVAGETEIFLNVQQAYETLSNSTRRAQYDATLPPAPQTPSLPYEHKIIYSRRNLGKINEPQMLYAMLDLDAPQETRRASSSPLNVSLVIDRSTSMQGAKMDTVKATAIQVLRNLRPQDILSVVTFSDRAEVVIPAAYHLDRARLESRVQMIQPAGGTEIYHGLEAGAREIMRSLDPKRINHLILLTDGRTYGDEQQSLELAAKLAEQGVGISCMGIGSEWNDIFLDAISTRAGGSTNLIVEPRDINRLLLEKFDALIQTYAEDAALEFKPITGVELSRVFRIQPDPAPVPLNEGKIRLGPILQDTSTRVIFEYIIQPTEVQSGELTFMEASLKVAITSHPFPVPSLRLRLQMPVADPSNSGAPPAEIQQALSRLMLYQMQEQAREELKKGNVAKAARHLERLATNLLTQGERSLAQTVMFEADSIKKNRSLSEEGSKRMKYGTRMLFLAPPKKELAQ